MRLGLLTSTGERHGFVARALAQHHELALIVREQKGFDNTYRDRDDRSVIDAHFDRLAQTECAYFGAGNWDRVNPKPITVERGNLNTAAIANAIQAAELDGCVVFGCGIIRDPVASVLPANATFNLHQGLSPYYRGSGTNFWPFVEERLEYIGVTVHLIDPGIDTGGIIAHARPAIEESDTMHGIGCKTVTATIDVLLQILRLHASGERLVPVAQWDGGRLYRRADLTGDAILRARELEADGVVGRFVAARERGERAPVRLILLVK